MIKNILNREEYKEIIIVSHLQKRKFNEEYSYLESFLYDISITWDRKLTGLNHFLSIILEQFEKADEKNKPIIDFVYRLEFETNFEIQEGSIEFLESLFLNTNDSSETLEEQLINAEDRLNGR